MTAERQPTNRMERETELLWGVRRPAPRRGPKPKLSREAVVAAAVALADAEGLEAVSMQRVAKELGFTTMSLYRHVDSKEDLLALMGDAVLDAEPPEPSRDRDWRAGVEAWVRGVLALYRNHPWAVYLAMTGPPSGPNGLRWMEAGLRELVRSGLDPGEALPILTLLSTTLRETFRIDVDMERAARATGATVADTMRGYAAGLRRFVTEERFPTVARLLREGGLEDSVPDGTSGASDDLDFSVRRLLDGVEVYVRGQRTAAGGG
ncbi:MULTISPECIES: TetR/AcrR family transcriptional regulator [unclassified Nocardiopsis]|uniref:TetR/AcrR family transcriptional regulator n=1 Tax=unclassified Nocardiopsis TaxID=2649073 RepID=UPI0013579B0C|nr:MULTISPECIES: TetR/AcrR family transcriptional regulator [unclassified Nocardiopsis]